MSLRIENQICYIDTDEVRGQWPANEVTIITDSEKSMSAVELQGQRVYITEAGVGACP